MKLCGNKPIKGTSYEFETPKMGLSKRKKIAIGAVCVLMVTCIAFAFLWKLGALDSAINVYQKTVRPFLTNQALPWMKDHALQIAVIGAILTVPPLLIYTALRCKQYQLEKTIEKLTNQDL